MEWLQETLDPLVTPVLDQEDEGLFFYRGEADKDWKVQAGIYRNEKIARNEKENILKTISFQAGNFKDDQTMFDFLVRAQHFGAPTRLADVARNPLAALWFACSSEERLADDGKMVIFYMKDNKTLKYHNSDRVSILANLATLSELEREALRKKGDSEDKKNAKKTLESAVRNEKPGFEASKITDNGLKRPLLMLPKQNNERIIGQQGAFIIFGLDKELPPDWRVFVSVYEIPWYAKGEILKALEVRGIHKQSIYPDIQNCAQHLKDSLMDTIGQLKKEAKWEPKDLEAGNKEAQFQLGLRYFQGYRIKKDQKAAIELWEQAANPETPHKISTGPQYPKGYAKAQYSLGEIYKNGVGTKKDLIKAKKYWEAAAEQGHKEAQYNLGLIYYTGNHGVQKNFSEAQKYLQKAADQEHAEAQYNLGVMCYEGNNESEVKRHWEAAAKQGHAGANYNLGGMCYERNDESRAQKYWEEAAKKLHAKAQYNLGVFFQKKAERGLNIKQWSQEIELRYYEKVSEQEHENVKYDIDVISKKETNNADEASKEKERCLEVALRYYEKAALQGIPEAQFYCATMYEKKEGVDKALEDKQRLNEAGKYYERAKDNDNAGEKLKKKAKDGFVRAEGALATLENLKK